MNRDQKAAVIEEIAAQIQDSDAVFAVDYRGISVPQAAELRGKLREADASLRVVKNTLTERAADRAGAEGLKALLEGPTALTFVRGDAALAAKAIHDYARATNLLPFKGGLMGGDVLAPEQIQAIARLPSRDALYGQLVGMVASPITGLVRTLNALIAGVAIQLGQIAEMKAFGELPAGDAPAPPVAEPEAAAPEESEAAASPESAAEAPAEPEAEAPAEPAAEAEAETEITPSETEDDQED